MTRFLLVVLKYRRGLKSSLPIDFLLSIWYSHWPVAEDIVISALLKTANVDEYKEMIQLVLANMVSFFAFSALTSDFRKKKVEYQSK